MMPPAMAKIATWLLGSECVPNHRFASAATYVTAPESTDATVASSAKP